jgi:hypothetical protein
MRHRHWQKITHFNGNIKISKPIITQFHTVTPPARTNQDSGERPINECHPPVLAQVHPYYLTCYASQKDRS